MMSESTLESLKETYGIEATGLIYAIEELNKQIAELNPEDKDLPRNCTASIAKERRFKLRKRLARLDEVYVKWSVDPRILHEVKEEIYSTLDCSKDSVETKHGMGK